VPDTPCERRPGARQCPTLIWELVYVDLRAALLLV
jgi:hypothetical protein